MASRLLFTGLALFYLAACSVGRMAVEIEVLEPKEEGVSNVPIPGAYVHLQDNSTGYSTEGYTDQTGFAILEMTVTDDDDRQFTITIEKNGFNKTVQLLSGNRTTGINDRIFLSRAE